MSTLWTPGGERPVPPPGGGRGQQEARQAPDSTREEPGSRVAGPDEEQLAQLRRQLADTPAESVVANHCYGLFELAALHLSMKPPRLDQARTAIDALGFLVEGMGDRLGPDSTSLKDGLAQIRLAFVQIGKAGGSGDGQASDQPGSSGGAGGAAE